MSNFISAGIPAELASLGTSTATFPSSGAVVVLAGDLGNTAASPQVVSTHLTAALPVAQGGTGTTSTLTGVVRGGSPVTASELSGDITTSGSNVTTLATVATPGTNTKVTFNAKGLVTSGATATLASADFANQGTTTTVLHGNAAGNPAFSAVSLTADVSGVLPTANGGTNQNSTATFPTSGTVATGTGTTNTVPKFTTGASGIIGNSSVTDNGTIVTFTEPLILPQGVVGAPCIGISGDAGTGFFQASVGNLSFDSSGTVQNLMAANLLRNRSTTAVSWSTGDPTAAGGDINLNRAAANVLGIGTGETVNSNGWFNYGGQKRVSTQFDKTDTTLTNITGLSVTILAGRTYRFRAVLWVTANVTGGQKYAIGGGATATSIIYNIITVNNTTNAIVISSKQTALGGSAGQAAATDDFTTIDGMITVNAGGTLTVQFAQNAASGTSSVLVGSNFTVDDVA